MVSNSNSVVWMCMVFIVRMASNSNFCLDVQAMEFDVLLSLDNINLCT
jgi:hypothetical protein